MGLKYQVTAVWPRGKTYEESQKDILVVADDERKKRSGGRREADTMQTVFCSLLIADLFLWEDGTHLVSRVTHLGFLPLCEAIQGQPKSLTAGWVTPPLLVVSLCEIPSLVVGT